MFGNWSLPPVPLKDLAPLFSVLSSFSPILPKIFSAVPHSLLETFELLSRHPKCVEVSVRPCRGPQPDFIFLGASPLLFPLHLSKADASFQPAKIPFFPPVIAAMILNLSRAPPRVHHPLRKKLSPAVESGNGYVVSLFFFRVLFF